MFRRLQAEVTHFGNLLGQFHNHSHSVEIAVCMQEQKKKQKKAMNLPRQQQLETLLFILAQNPKVNLRLAVGDTTPPPPP